jgi:phenylalanyl-tRNA synthetase beta chain
MLYSFKLLSSLVDLEGISVQDLIDKLTFGAFEVDGCKKAASASKLVIGHILSCQKHPDSDHLHVLKVDCGQEGVKDIVCGAPNVQAGQKVIVALVGCELPAISETIKASEIRGCKSEGMCCSLTEIGVDKAAQSKEDLEGIHILPEDAPVGEKDVLGYLGLDDTILDISVLPNRPDCLCHLGMARELACLLERKMKDVAYPLLTSKKASIEVSSATPSCDKFLLAEVKGLKEGPTPEYVVKYLRALGLRSVSKIVDLGNYSMLLTGQPLHMYDLDKVEGKRLTVRDDFEGDFTALDEKSYKLIKNDIVIEDEKKVCCLGGVMGGKDVAVDDKTVHIGIEAAHFYYANIRHTSNRLGLVSDSSSLFAKGVNPYTTEEAMEITLSLLKEFFPEAEVEGISSYSTVKPLTSSYAFSYDVCNSHLGMKLSKDEIDQILSRLGLKCVEGKIASIPHRLDLVEQCDIDEEVFRLEPREKISMSLSGLPQTAGSLSDKQVLYKKIREQLIGMGLDQCITYTLVNQKLDKAFRIFDEDSGYKVLHPLTEDHQYVRTDLLSSIENSLEYNLSRKNLDVRLFEISDIDTPKGNHTYLAFGMIGNISERGMLKGHQADFFDAKGVAYSILDLAGLDERRFTLVRSKNPSFHPYRSADILIGKKLIGTFGEVNPALHLGKMVLGELDLGFISEQKSSKTKAAPLPVLQPLRRDLAFKLLDENVTSEDIIRAIKKAGGKYVTKSEVFDIFVKDNATYMAFASYFVKEDKSFTDGEINSLMNTIILNVTHTLKVELRS